MFSRPSVVQILASYRLWLPTDAVGGVTVEGRTLNHAIENSLKRPPRSRLHITVIVCCTAGEQLRFARVLFPVQFGRTIKSHLISACGSADWDFTSLQVGVRSRSLSFHRLFVPSNVNILYDVLFQKRNV